MAEPGSPLKQQTSQQTDRDQSSLIIHLTGDAAWTVFDVNAVHTGNIIDVWLSMGMGMWESACFVQLLSTRIALDEQQPAPKRF